METNTNRQDAWGGPMVLGIAIGIAIGLAIGTSMGNPGVGIAIGIGIGIALGLAFREARNDRGAKPDDQQGEQ